jgi:hypothetical protein
MTMSKHTPGPWQCYHDGPSVEPNWYIVTNASRMRVLANVHIGPGNAADLANAHLITAAPDLLAVVQEIVARFEGHGAMTDAELRPIACAAFAKAIGAEPTPTTDTAQGALFDLPATKPASAIAEGR